MYTFDGKCAQVKRGPMSSSLVAPDIPLKHFRFVRVLGKGSFGEVYEALDERTGAHVAVKTENEGCPNPQLRIENKILLALRGVRGFPEVYGFVELPRYRVLVMQKLTQSLEQLRLSQPDGVLSPDKIMSLGAQCLERLEALHARAYVHRDIKPDNFMLSDGIVYLIDFGMVKRIVHPETGEHITDNSVTIRVGTPRYQSIRAQDYRQQSRRDDLESLVYMLVYLARGYLPWQRSRGVDSECTLDVKRETTPDLLCDGLLNGKLAAVLKYARELPFEAMPDYNWLFSAFTPSASLSYYTG